VGRRRAVLLQTHITTLEIHLHGSGVNPEPVGRIDRRMQTPAFVRSSAESRESGRREIDLVILSMRALVSGGKDVGLRGFLEQAQPETADQCFDWEKVQSQAEYHSITAALAFVLLQSGADLIPQGVSERLRQRLHATARDNMRWLAEWHHVLTVFEKAGIAVISLKGPALAMQAYGDLALREFSDLDFLIHPDNAIRARDVLAAEGYQPSDSLMGNRDAMLLRSANRQLEFVNAERGTQIDLHWGALHAMFPYQLPVNELFQSSRLAQLEGASFLSLSPENTLLYLCVHGTKHCWIRLRWLCDVALYMRSEQNLDLKQCASLAEATNCGLVLKHSLLMAKNVLGLELPAEIRSFAEAKEAQALATTVCSFMFSETAHLHEGEMMRYHLAFGRGWRDRVRFLRYRIFVPAEPDWNAVRLPQPLYLLYYLIRPVRIIMERLSRAASGPS
jgi:hypothetical protein